MVHSNLASNRVDPDQPNWKVTVNRYILILDGHSSSSIPWKNEIFQIRLNPSCQQEWKISKIGSDKLELTRVEPDKHPRNGNDITRKDR